MSDVHFQKSKAVKGGHQDHPQPDTRISRTPKNDWSKHLLGS